MGLESGVNLGVIQVYLKIVDIWTLYGLIWTLYLTLYGLCYKLKLCVINDVESIFLKLNMEEKIEIVRKIWAYSIFSGWIRPCLEAIKSLKMDIEE